MFKGFSLWAANHFDLETAVLLNEARAWATLAIKRRWNPHEGRFWFAHTRKQWNEDLPFIPVPTLRKRLDSLITSGILLVRHGAGNIAFYAVDFEALEGLRSTVVRKGFAVPYSDAAMLPDEADDASETSEVSVRSDLLDPTSHAKTVSGRISQIRGSDPTDPTSLPLEEQIEEQIHKPLAARKRAASPRKRKETPKTEETQETQTEKKPVKGPWQIWEAMADEAKAKGKNLERPAAHELKHLKSAIAHAGYERALQVAVGYVRLKDQFFERNLWRCSLLWSQWSTIAGRVDGAQGFNRPGYHDDPRATVGAEELALLTSAEAQGALFEVPDDSGIPL